MELELFLAVQGHHHGERHKRADFSRQRWVAPDLAPGGAGDEILPGHRKGAGVLQRALDVLDPEHTLAVGEPRLEAHAAGADGLRAREAVEECRETFAPYLSFDLLTPSIASHPPTAYAATAGAR